MAETPEPGTPEYDQAMADKFDSQSADDVPAEQKDDLGSVAQEAAKPEKPEGVPDKFWDAEKGEVKTEDLIKSYQELEKKNSKPEEESVEKQLENRGIAQEDMQSWEEAYMRDGEVPAEAYEKLEEVGINKQMVDDYLAGQRAAQDRILEQTVGSREEFNKMSEWAATNMPVAELQQYNEMLEANQVNMALNYLKEKYVSANGEAPAEQVEGSVAVDRSGYQSSYEMQKDMKSEAYRKDPAFRRKVQAKLAQTEESVLFGS